MWLVEEDAANHEGSGTQLLTWRHTSANRSEPIEDLHWSLYITVRPTWWFLYFVVVIYVPCVPHRGTLKILWTHCDEVSVYFFWYPTSFFTDLLHFLSLLHASSSIRSRAPFPFPPFFPHFLILPALRQLSPSTPAAAASSPLCVSSHWLTTIALSPLSSPSSSSPLLSPPRPLSSSPNRSANALDEGSRGSTGSNEN